VQITAAANMGLAKTNKIARSQPSSAISAASFPTNSSA
jgi:hypothetical protein